MSDEVVVPEGQEPESKPVDLSPVEQDAVAQGWVPKEEFDGDEHKWVDAAEFLRRGELFKKIETQSREIKATRQALAAFKEHYASVEKAAHDRALKELQAQRKAAFSDGDFDKVTALEEEIDEVKENSRQAISQVNDVAQEAAVHPEFAAWVSRNDWYVSQPHMKTFADHKGIEYARAGLSPSEVLKKVDAEVRKEFPNKFTNPNREKPSAVEGSSNRGSTRARSDGVELSDQERNIMNTLVRGGHITKEKYLADLKKAKGE